MIIYLAGNGLESDHAYNICDILKNNQSIKKIDLSKYIYANHII